jgi:hypothetical protein
MFSKVGMERKVQKRYRHDGDGDGTNLYRKKERDCTSKGEAKPKLS